MKGLKKRIISNLKILVIAFILALGLFFVVKNPEFFKASVLLLEDKQTIEANERDIGYKNSNNLLDVFIAEQLVDFSALDFVVIMDPDSIEVNLEDIDSQLEFEIIEQSDDSFKLHMIASTGVDYTQSLFMLAFTGTDPFILLGEGLSFDKDGKEKTLAIGNLDEYKQVHQK